MEAGVPVICGSTGWNEELPKAEEKCRATGTALLQASNFSIGVNIFFEINKRLAALMNGQADYEVTVEEVHHTEKKGRAERYRYYHSRRYPGRPGPQGYLGKGKS